MNRVRQTSLWAKDQLFVDAAMLGDGSVSFEGQDLRHGEYEYFFTVKSENVAALVMALGGPDGADVLHLLEANAAELLRVGEMTWLKEHSIPYDFFSP